MPPHCDSMDGPVVMAALQALHNEDVNLVLPYVPKYGENEVKNAFHKVVQLRRGGDLAKEVADRYFFETVVRIHRAGEGEPYTGLKPAGLSEGPVIPIAEAAIETGSADKLVEALTSTISTELSDRFDKVRDLQRHSGSSNVDEAREYVEAMLGLIVWSHKVYLAAKSGPHESGHHQSASAA